MEKKWSHWHTEGNLPNYPITILHRKTYPTILLRFYVELLDHIVTLTWCLLNYIFNRACNILSLIISNFRLYGDSLNSCLWRIIETIYFVSLSFDMIVGVCTFPLFFCTTVSVFHVSLYFLILMVTIFMYDWVWPSC